jgi:hypothetical protein
MHTINIEGLGVKIIDNITILSNPITLGLAIKNSEGYWIFRPYDHDLNCWQLIDIAQTVGMMNQNKPL